MAEDEEKKPQPQPEPEPQPEGWLEKNQGEAENHDHARHSKQWRADDETELTEEYNREAAAALAQKRIQQDIAELEPGSGDHIVGGRTTELRIDPKLLDIDEDESARAVSRQARFDGLLGFVRRWWFVRQAERNKAHGMDPFVRVRLGKRGKWERTDCVLTTVSDTPEAYTNPRFNDTHNRLLCLKRSPGDGGELIVEAMDETAESDRFIGGCHVHLSEFIRRAEQTTDWGHTMFHLFDKQVGEDLDDTSEERDAGGVHASVRWVPEVDEQGLWMLDENNAAKGELHIKVMSATDLRDISALKISDISSFVDKTALHISLSMVVLTILSSVFGYRYFIWDGVDWNARGSEFPVLDTSFFVMATFTTVGFGTHPVINTPGRLATSIYVVLAIGLLGVFIGALGDVVQTNLIQKKKKKMHKKLKEMEARGEDTSNWMSEDNLMQEALENIEHRKEQVKSGEVKAEPDASRELIVQQEIGRVLEQHFWMDEARKAGFGLTGLAAIITLGTMIFAYTERDQCFPTRLGVERAEELLVTLRTDSSEWIKLSDEIQNCSLDMGCAVDPWRGDCDIGKVQGLGVVGGVYMTAVTASTVGFGDLTPQSPWGKLIAIFYAPVAVALLSKTVLAISMIPTEYRKLKLESYVLDQFGDSVATSDLEQLRQLVNLKEGEEIHQNDFTLAMLMRLGRVSKVDVLRTEQIFFNLDKDHSGEITKEDLGDLVAKQRRRIAKAQNMQKRNQNIARNARPADTAVMPQHFTPKGHFLNYGGETFDTEIKTSDHNGQLMHEQRS